jgi:amylosucrase
LDVGADALTELLGVWEAAGRSVDPATVEGRCFAALRRLGEVRRTTAAFRSDAETSVVPLENHHVLA